MDFTKIYNGMVGRDFIVAFNDNFNITDKTFLAILSTLIYKVKSTDIKEFKVINNVVNYTLDPEPEEGEEDTRIWTPVDITQWGNILGNIQDQTDLWNILEDKAAVETVETISNLLSTLRNEFDSLKDNVEDDESLLNSTSIAVANIEETLKTKVNSSNIKAIRLNNAVFQWSPDGNTWYEQPIVNSIAWGRLNGDITNQEDLMQRLNQINNNISELSSDITSILNSITNLNNSISNIDDTLQQHLIQDAADKSAINDTLSTTTNTANNANTVANSADDKIDAHLEDYNNPHHITKSTIGLENVDNTSDADKPLSTAQKNYVDTEINKVIDQSFDGIPILKKKGLVNHVFVGNRTLYNDIDPSGTLSFILDDDFFEISLYLYTENNLVYKLTRNDTEVEPDLTEENMKIYNDIIPNSDVYKVVIEVDGQEETFVLTIDFNKDPYMVNVDEFIINEGGNE